MKTMRNRALAATSVCLALLVPSTAWAQSDTPTTEVTIGATAGVHDLGLGDIATIGGSPVDDSGAIFGGFVAVDTPINDRLFIGAEGNASFGEGPIDSEYGVSARLGYRTDNGAKFYVRGGYQWVDLDLANLVDLPTVQLPAGFSDTVDDYLVGGGVEVPVGSVILRGNVDTISFDTLRATAGIGLRF